MNTKIEQLATDEFAQSFLSAMSPSSAASYKPPVIGVACQLGRAPGDDPAVAALHAELDA